MSTSTHSHGTLPEHITPEFLKAPWIVSHLSRRWAIAGAIGAVATIAAAVLAFGQDSFLARQNFFRAYLLGFMVFASLTLGSLALLMLHSVTNGKWGLILRRMLEAGAKNILLLALLFIPLAFGLEYIYPWMEKLPGGLDAYGKHALHVRHGYLNANAFLIRAVLYFIGWGVFVWFLTRWSKLQDVPPASPEAATRLRLRFMRLGGFGLLFYAVTVSLAAIDWVMSLDPVWYSTIWGMLYMAGQALMTMAFMLVTLVALAKHEPMKSLLRKTEMHDNGKLLLAFVMLYTYLSFSQFLIIWSANMIEEITWYKARTAGAFFYVMIFLVLFHFVVPFLILLNRNLKKQGSRLAAVAMMIVFVRVMEMYWHIVPQFTGWRNDSGAPMLTWMDAVIPFTMLAIWAAAFFYNLSKAPILPAYHNAVPEILEESHGAH